MKSILFKNNLFYNNTMNIQEILKTSVNSGLSGGTAMVFQVSSLMWLRTTMNYQFKNGGGTLETLKLLYKDGGFLRFYRGYFFALMQGPISRFGDTGMNHFASIYFQDSNVFLRTGIGSLGATGWRILIMPNDACKSHLQIHGREGLNILRNKIKSNGVRTLWNGAGASIGANFIGHYPWFLTYNYLSETLPKYNDNRDMVRSMGIGFTSSSISDTVSNSIRVLKINRQTSQNPVSYTESLKSIVSKEGIIGFMTRGLKTKIMMNGIQSSMFVLIYDKLKSL